MQKFELILTCLEDDLVVEIWYQDNLIAIVRDNDEILFFDKIKNKNIITNKYFNSAVENAKKKLMGKL